MNFGVTCLVKNVFLIKYLQFVCLKNQMYHTVGLYVRNSLGHTSIQMQKSMLFACS